MQWTAEAIVIGTRRHGETSTILEVMVREKGRHLGLVRGGRSRRLRPVLQPGNTLRVTWRARLDEHLGAFTVEPLRERAAVLMATAAATFGIQLVGVHLRLLPERDPHPRLFDALAVIVDALDEKRIAAELMARFELLLLDELGVGLDLSRCAVTGQKAGLTYVSPKTGRAVSAQAGRPYDNRLLKLPEFLIDRRRGEPPSSADLESGFRLTGHFLDRHVYEPRGLSPGEARAGFLRAVLPS
ncbi:MAG: DNA repair protein RecO [Alphaproteobacteria bacterium]|nr:MAG: DNA repair protein RecO [Alphaproteobacteria bacterium]